METKNQESMVLKELECMQLDHHYIVPPHSPGEGGLYLGWKKELTVSILSASDNYIDAKILHKGKSFQATFVYGAPEHSKRQEVWNQVTNLASAADEPWFLTGDFNDIIDNGEKSGGVERAEGTFGAFRTFISRNDLFDIKHT